MSPFSDPLYNIFEQHLFNALIENESTEEFITRVVQDYMGRLSALGTSIPHHHRATVETDLREEVLEMLRKKTYGHYNLAEFRKAKTTTAPMTSGAQLKSPPSTGPQSSATASVSAPSSNTVQAAVAKALAKIKTRRNRRAC